jgi:hypothetical protein
MEKNGNGCKNPRNSLVAATFEKANTYAFAAPIIRDREVGGSNPLAPTININNLRLPNAGGRNSFVANLWILFSTKQLTRESMASDIPFGSLHILKRFGFMRRRWIRCSNINA